MTPKYKIGDVLLHTQYKAMAWYEVYNIVDKEYTMRISTSEYNSSSNHFCHYFFAIFDNEDCYRLLSPLEKLILGAHKND